MSVLIAGFRWVTLMLLLMILLPGWVQAQISNTAETEVSMRLFLLDIEEVDTVAQSFRANMTLVAQWHEPGLAHDEPGPIARPLNTAGLPKIQFLNQQSLAPTLPQLVEVYPDGRAVYRQRFWGSFSQPLNLRLFPFDSQQLQIKLSGVSFGSSVVTLTPDEGSGIASTLTIPDWEVLSWEFTPSSFVLDDEANPIEGLAFTLSVERDTSFFIYKVIFPLILIVIMSWMVFWIDPTLVTSQISVSVTAILTMIAYRFALTSLIPRLPFLTSLDYFVLASTLIVFLSMVQVIYTAYLATNDRIEKARTMDRRARIIFPLAYLLMASETLIFRVFT